MLCEYAKRTQKQQPHQVLILVLMEDALRGRQGERQGNGRSPVLILVLMEDALRDCLPNH